MFIYEGINNLVSGAFLKCFSIFKVPAFFHSVGLSPLCALESPSVFRP